MTKKHFIALADMIRQYPGMFNDNQLSMLASFCSDQNWRFNKQRWLDYIAGNCGPNGGAIKTPGGNTADYTVEFEPTPEQPIGWNKSTNLEVA